MEKEVMGSIPACAVCEVRGKYGKEVKAYNSLVTMHNALIDDSNALLGFLEDITKGLRVSLCDGQIIHPTMVSETKLMTKPTVLLDPYKEFIYEFHNEIAGFILDLRSGKRAKDVYQDWIQKCITIHKNNKQEETV
jgi:hypothetical protein